MKMETFKPNKEIVRLAYFWSGVIATIAYRIIIVLTNFDPIWLKITWYIGTIGFVFYFAHRFAISERRVRLIKEYRLDKKISELPNLTPDEKGALGYIVGSLVSSLERWNYIIIFVTSGLSLIWGILTDFILK